MQTKKKLVAILSIASLLMSSSFIDTAKAASLSHASDTLSNSSPNTTANHSVKFDVGQGSVSGDYFQVILPVGFGSIADVAQITCPASTTRSLPNGSTAVCTVNADIATSTTLTIAITGVTNPVGVGVKDITIESRDSGDAMKEGSVVKVSIIDNVTLNASVPSTLSFAISGVASTAPAVNGSNLTGDSSTTTVNFGTLEVGTSSVLGQQLAVTTNATYGYSVTVQQDNVLTNAAGATIDSFDNGTVPGAPQGWANPTGSLGATSTYGHMAFTTSDASLNGIDFSGSKWFGFTDATPVQVMYHSGPANGTSDGVGLATVAYRVQITALQEAGDYTNKLTYVATPSY